jgi:hypothetical protein
MSESQVGFHGPNFLVTGFLNFGIIALQKRQGRVYAVRKRAIHQKKSLW